MLRKPRHGWSTITIGDWSDRCSYVDDVPFMLLEALEESCRTFKPVAVEFDAEGYEYIIVFNSYETHIISNKDDTYTHTCVPIGRNKLAKELIDDITADLDDWAWWLGEYEEMYEERKKDLTVMCNILKRRLPIM